MAFVLSDLDAHYFPTPWTLDNWKSISEQDRLLVVMMNMEQVAGFCLFDKSVPDSFAHLLKILIIPELRNQGHSRVLLENAIGQLRQEGCSRLFLEVEENNHAAQKLYYGLGFSIVHRKKDFYGENRNALIMTLGH
jgi:ribosomal-protein-alanine N-acetyltransferase